MTTEQQARCERASLAAKQALADSIAALGAVRLRDAAAARGIDPDSAGVWAKRGLSRSAFRGPRGVWCVREAEFDVELAQWRCTWDGCERYALLSKSGRCHEHAGCAEPDGRLTAEELAVKYGLNLGYLLERLASGEIPAERVDRQGHSVQRDQFHATWRITAQAALEALDERFRCRTDECNRYALAPSGYCAACTTTRMQAARWPESPGKVRKVCPGCGGVREVYPSLQRAGDLCVHCYSASEDRETSAALEAEGLVPIKMASRMVSLSPNALRSVVTPERRELGRRAYGRLGVNARHVLEHSTDPHARRKLSKPLAALNRVTGFGSTNLPGRPMALSGAEVETVVSLRAADPARWGWRTLAKKLNEKRPADKQVDHTTVMRAWKRATAPAPALLTA